MDFPGKKPPKVWSHWLIDCLNTFCRSIIPSGVILKSHWTDMFSEAWKNEMKWVTPELLDHACHSFKAVYRQDLYTMHISQKFKSFWLVFPYFWRSRYLRRFWYLQWIIGNQNHQKSELSRILSDSEHCCSLTWFMPGGPVLLQCNGQLKGQ